MSQKQFTEEHNLLAQSLRAFVQKEIVPNVEKWEKANHCPPEIFKMMGEQGFLGVSFPESVGGSGMDMWASVVLMRELTYANIGGLAMSLYAHTFLPLPLINSLGTEYQKQNYLAPALRADKIAALAITEPGAGSDVGGVTTKAEDMGDHYLVNGAKTFITNGTLADFVVTVCRTGEGHNLSLLIIDTASEGFHAEVLHDKLGMHSSDTAALFFENVKVPKENLIGKANMGFYYLMNNIQEERLIAAVMGTYAAEWALEKAKGYIQEREAFGRAIGKFQVVRHKIARMAINLEAMRSITFRAVSEFIETGPKAVAIISMAKAYVSEECLKVINEALQLHGGWGFMEEYGLARAYRDLRLMSIGAGTTEVMLEILSKMVIDDKQHERILMDARK
ncbi:MAG: acyl-CoA dehydrogenase family protein [Bacteroidia bacterium]|nr:acyl-CoA dehydrogenase family protein [Bacteroidia bacterium]